MKRCPMGFNPCTRCHREANRSSLHVFDLAAARDAGSRSADLETQIRHSTLNDAVYQLRATEADLRSWLEHVPAESEIGAEMGLRLGNLELVNRALEREGY